MFWERNPSSISHSPEDEEAWNDILDIEEKRVALKVSPSVVALVSYSGDEKVTEGSGTIIESNNDITIVLTSANLIRCSSGGKFMKNDMINDLKVIVYYCDGQSYTGEIFAFDYHYNLAAISFRSQVPLPTAKIGEVDDSLDVLPSPLSFELRPHSCSYKLSPEAKVLAVGRMGRFSYNPFAPVVASGAYWVGRCGYDCKELFKASCKIRECGEGGPLVNHLGEVIGITYYDFSSTRTPCMPISIAYKWWEHFRTHRKYRRPLLGMEAGNFYTASMDVVERVNQIFPSLRNGVVVEEVTQGSSADLAGLCVDDVIIECAGEKVKSILEFFKMIWENVGDHVNLAVVRQDSVEPIHLCMFVGEAALDQFNRWPNLR